jgi:hypothetical protein
MVLMQKWLLVGLLLLPLHFAASYRVPLDAQSQGEFGGLLRWFWPWSYGDSGLLGQITRASGFPIAGFYVAMAAGGVLGLAALAVAGIWVGSNGVVARPGDHWSAAAGGPGGPVLRSNKAHPIPRGSDNGLPGDGELRGLYGWILASAHPFTRPRRAR